jgi:membrane protease YdiL (CAAX protease family)
VLDPASAEGAPPAAQPELDPTAPDTRGGGPTLAVQRLGAAIEVLLCSGFPTQILLIGVLTSYGLPTQTAAGRLSPTFVFTISLLDAALVIGLVFFFLKAHGESGRAMFLGKRPILREALIGLILLPVIFVLVLLVLLVVITFAPQLHNVPRNPFEDMLQTRGDVLIFAVVVMVAGGVREEIQRGFILCRFEQYLGGGAVGLIVYSGVFGLGHLEQGFDASLATAVLGAAWGGIYLARRSVVAPMVSHAGFNLAQLFKYVTLAVR